MSSTLSSFATDFDRFSSIFQARGKDGGGAECGSQTHKDMVRMQLYKSFVVVVIHCLI